MRTPFTGEIARLNGATYNIHVNSESQDADGAWQSHNTLQGRDWLTSFKYRGDADTPYVTGTIELARADRTLSMAPLVTGSLINRNAAAAYAPFLEVGRRFRVKTAITASGVAPVSGDWRYVCEGYIDKVGIGGRDDNSIVVECRDLGALLVKTQIEVIRQYGSPAGTAVETVMQSILNDNFGVGAVVLYTPVSPNWLIHEFSQKLQSVMEAIRALAKQIGYEVRYVYDASNVLRLTFYAPDRSKVVSDYTIGPSVYTDVTRLDLDIVDVRNAWTVEFIDRVTGTKLQSTATSAPSIAQYGRLPAKVAYGYSSNIDSMTEANKMTAAALADTAFPKAIEVIDLMYYPLVDIADLITLTANGEHYDADQQRAVFGYEHDLRDGDGTTVLTTRGKPAGGYDTWMSLIANPQELVESSFQPDLDIKLVGSSDTTVTYSPHATIPNGSALSLFYGFGDDPITTPVANDGSIVVPRATNASDDRHLRVMAISVTGAVVTKNVTVDYDLIPEIGLGAEATPIYTGGSQTGWRIRGTVDDDTRAIVIAITSGLVLGIVSPAGAYGIDGNWWSDTTSQKNWTIDLVQAPGERGTVTVTPREFYNSAVGGLGGAPFQVTLERPGIVVPSVREMSATQRDVTLTANPSTATINYRVDGGTWTTAVGKVTFSLDVSGANRVVEFYSTTSLGTVEEVKRLVIDKNSQPGITATVLTESSPNNLHLVMGFDDDVVHWRMWARRNLWPTVNSTDPSISQGPPLDEYKRYDGGMEKTTLDWRAGGNGDGTSTWYVVVRAYDDVGTFVQQISSKLVSGAPPAVGSLSNLRVQYNTESTVHYNDVIWDHNQTIQDVSHTVTVRENGTQLVIGRDARLEHDGGSAIALLGGYHIVHPRANPTDPGAVFLTFNYEVDLRRSSDNGLVATYAVPISGWFVGGGGGAPPAEIPNTLVAFGEQLQARGTWVNPVATWQLHLEWERWNGAAWVAYSNYDLAANTATHTQTGLVAGDQFRFRVRYFNAYGNGTYSAYSAGVVIQAAGSPPSETPSAPVATVTGSMSASAAWTNTSSAYKIFIEWYRKLGGVGAFVFDSSFIRLAGTSVAPHGAFTDPHTGDRVYFRCRYFNDVGDGPWSVNSNQVDLIP